MQWARKSWEGETLKENLNLATTGLAANPYGGWCCAILKKGTGLQKCWVTEPARVESGFEPRITPAWSPFHTPALLSTCLSFNNLLLELAFFQNTYGIISF